MKKVLFATTALVATAGVAAADVTFGGYGRFGVIHVTNPTGTNETNVTSRFRLQIDATAESDAGVTFGARVRLEGEERDETNGNRPSFNGVRYFARSGGLEVGVGNIFGALEFMPGMYPIDLGLTGHNYDYTAYNFGGDAYSSGGLGSAGSNGVELLYSAGDFSVHVSASETQNADRIAAHIAYTWNGWTFALGGQDSDLATDTELAASVGGSFGPVDVTLAFADNGTKGDHIVLAGRVDVGAATNVEAYVADADQWADTSFGIDFNHDLGGGTSLRGGVSTGGSLGDESAVDFGVRFNF
ncbi:porin [Sulfitobacter sp. JBTF-M27]|uniref:Porin n=1 Tax=Sulfitobacter sediminilitoris TaxID=2698830 RepID=A0A6P0CC10_9RHOB|nr:porin [Sulfitobacter sediminilitoris]NEK22698.1 porin [Sulfitobacter sediminilitoris]